MNQEAALAERATHPDRPTAVDGRADAHVRAYRLLLARALWLAASALATGIFMITRGSHR